jgi:hypothetical protein
MRKLALPADPAEAFREFVTRRTWLHGEGRLLSDQDYASLKARDGKFWKSLKPFQISYLMGFMAGWRAS